MTEMERIRLAADTVRDALGEAEIGIVLGSGLGEDVNSLQNAKFIEYKAIAGFPVSTAPGHARQMVGRRFGRSPRLYAAGPCSCV